MVCFQIFYCYSAGLSYVVCYNWVFVIVGFVIVGFVRVGFLIVGFVMVGFVIVGFAIAGFAIAGFVIVGFVIVGLVIVGFVIAGFVIVGCHCKLVRKLTKIQFTVVKVCISTCCFDIRKNSKQ